MLILQLCVNNTSDNIPNSANVCEGELSPDFLTHLEQDTTPQVAESESSRYVHAYNMYIHRMIS